MCVSGDKRQTELQLRGGTIDFARAYVKRGRRLSVLLLPSKLGPDRSIQIRRCDRSKSGGRKRESRAMVSIGYSKSIEDGFE